MNFTTEQIIVSPTVTTSSPSDITETSATVGGNVIADGGATVTERGVYYSTSASPETTGTKLQIGSGTGTFSTSLTGLSAGTTYYIKAYATNSIGTSYDSEVTFTTLTPPSITTTAISAITENSAESGGNVIDDGGASVTARGVCWNTSQNPTITNDHTTDGSGTGNFTSSITGLIQNTIYYVRAYATNSVGTGYGEQVSFTTLNAVTDYDGNVYPIVSIGTQIWMAKNLKTTKYNDGTAIPLITDGTEWSNLTTHGYCWYNNDEASYKNTYGALYNWHTVNTGKLCLTGWHVPTDSEWTILETYLGGSSVAGGKMKETGTAHWVSPNTGATNESGFTALPGGARYQGGDFYDLGYDGYWWTSTEASSLDSWNRYVYWTSTSVVDREERKVIGYSVRCVKD